MAGEWLSVHKTADGDGFYLQSTANAGSSQRRATILVTVDNGGTPVYVRVPVTQDFTEAGFGGVAKDLPFGNTTVKTHILGGNAREYMRIAQMVKNGFEPNADLTDAQLKVLLDYLKYIPGDDYYTCWMVSKPADTSSLTGGTSFNIANWMFPLDEAEEICPEGWRLPNYYDVMTLLQIGVFGEIPEFDFTDELAAAKEFMNYGYGYDGRLYAASIMEDVGEKAYFWNGWDGMVSSEAITEFMKEYPDVYTPADYPEFDQIFPKINSSSAVTFTWLAPAENYVGYELDIDAKQEEYKNQYKMPVRCVQDREYRYE
jgi:hypothetical protein